ncbi:Uncharacterised protein family Cys-rich [Plasmopara halstedii]|uniref:Uncharacterized protein family Cys-rich n=1 Tax=Plasmopara halstedii TaxID=4781 RepID=A0A0P1B0G3_PLAHL|nr:Uncharacterised protein family Cys-rich [Plasmopara halstedii]CEG47621.1 Uncharacterised protein family Cys-rich [Plasmopara halstedii]|eukprot:XP_024583990.1 Uncharacterised protein family Cys-rich [Plasmopara halstedii]
MDLDPQSSRAHFTKVNTPSQLAPVQTSTTNYMPSPSRALELDTPRGPEYIAGDGIPTGAWATGLFDCFDNLIPNCFMVTLCPCVAVAQLSTRLGDASYKLVLGFLVLASVVQLTMLVIACIKAEEEHDTVNGIYGSYDGKEVNASFVIIALAVQLLLLAYVWHLRMKTRRRFQLPGSMVTDCLSSWFCSCCTVAQLRTHVRCYQPGDCSFRAPDVLQAYPGKSYATVVHVKQASHAGTCEQSVMVSAWSADFCGCFDSMIPNCCMVTCCSCVALAQISERLGVAPYIRILVIFSLLSLAGFIAGLYPVYLNSHSELGPSINSNEYSHAGRHETNPAQSWTLTIVRAIFVGYIWYLRQITRRMFRIPGSSCGDFWASFCCSCCTLAQIATHVKSYKPGACSFGPPDVLPPYT